jgi:hypothetical protein
MKAVHIECPVCRAKPGEPCRAIGGKQMPESHSKRILIDLYKRHFGENNNLPVKAA